MSRVVANTYEDLFASVSTRSGSVVTTYNYNKSKVHLLVTYKLYEIKMHASVGSILQAMI